MPNIQQTETLDEARSSYAAATRAWTWSTVSIARSLRATLGGSTSDTTLRGMMPHLTAWLRALLRTVRL